MVNNIGDDENKMVSYKVVLWLLAVLLMLGWGTKAYADAMQAQDTLGDDGTLFLYAGAAVLIDADTGQVLYGKKRTQPDGTGQSDQNHDLPAGDGT